MGFFVCRMLGRFKYEIPVYINFNYIFLFIGKRWNMSSGLTVSPFIGVGYMLGELKASDGTYLELPDGAKADGGLTPNFGIEVGFMF